MRKKFLLIGAIAGTTLLAGGWALAQSQTHGHGRMGHSGMHSMHDQMGHGMHGHMGQGMHGRMGRGMDGRPGHGSRSGGGHSWVDPAPIEELKTELAITAAQEPAWTKYAKAVQNAVTARQTVRESVDPDALSKMSPADRFAFGSKVRERRQAQFETVETAADELLAALDDDQKAKAREILPGLAFGPGTMHGGLGGAQQHRH